MNRRTSAALVLAALLIGAGGFAAIRMLDTDGEGAGSPPGLTDEAPAADGGGPDAKPGASEEMTTGAGPVSDARTGAVSDRDAYEVVDALRVAGHEPVMGAELSFEWLDGGTDDVRVEGEFEGAGHTSFVLERVDGVWVVTK